MDATESLTVLIATSLQKNQVDFEARSSLFCFKGIVCDKGKKLSHLELKGQELGWSVSTHWITSPKMLSLLCSQYYAQSLASAEGLNKKEMQSHPVFGSLTPDNLISSEQVFEFRTDNLPRVDYDSDTGELTLVVNADYQYKYRMIEHRVSKNLGSNLLNFVNVSTE